jgi:hypothetical protein
MEDMVWLGTSNVEQSIEEHMQLAIPYSFGCQTSSKGMFRKQYADGIMGLANHDYSIVSTMAQLQAIPRNSFSMCFTQAGGHLSLGGTLPKQYHLEPMRLTPITKEHGWYSLQVLEVRVGHIVVASEEEYDGGAGNVQNSKTSTILESLNAGKGTILDSGTTDTYLPISIQKVFINAAREVTGGKTDFSDKKRTQMFSYHDFEMLPEIHFLFANNVTISIKPENYMDFVPVDETTGRAKPWSVPKTLTNRIYLDEKEGAVLGASAMIGYDILYDAQGHQVGIAQANCGATLPATRITSYR